jgi:hypothetical protein
MILYTPEDHGCAYSIDTEGTLFYVPIYTDGTLNLNEIAEVEYDEDLKEIHEKLINMMKSIGEYYQTVS